MAALLEELVAAEGRWSATQTRPEIADAGEVVTKRVQTSLDVIRETQERLRAWRGQVVTLDDRVVERREKVAVRARSA